MKNPGLILQSRSLRFIVLSFLILHSSFLIPCTCPGSSLSLDECNKYELIFRGRIDSVVNCDGKKGEAFFKVLELYKGTSTALFKVLFTCQVECAQAMNAGDEWIIYTRYRQIDNAEIDWCSRSRRRIKNEKEDFYLLSNGNTYDEELEFLRTKLGLHNLLKKDPSTDPDLVANRNYRPNSTQLIITLLCSIGGIILFYYLFNKFFK